MDLYAYFTIDDDINLFAAFPVDFVNNNMVNGKFAYDFRYQGKSTALASGNLTTSSEKKDGYYIVDLGPVDASNAKAPIICNGTLHYRITNALEIVARAGKNVDGSLNASEQVLFNALEDLFYEIEHIKNNPNGHYNYSENKVIEGVRKEVVAGLALHTIPSLKTIFSKGGTAIKSIGVVASNKGSLGFEIVVTSSAEPKLNFTWKGASAATTFNSDRCIIKNSGSGTYTIQIFLNVDELIKDFTLEIKNGNTVIETVNASLEKIAEIVINVNTGGDTEFDNDEENDSYTDNPTYKEVFPAVVLQMIQAIKHYEGVTTLPQMPNIKEELNAIPTIDNDARIQALIKKGSSRTAAENAELEAALRDIVVRYMKLQLTFPYTPVFAEGETKIYDYNTMNGNEPLSYVEERLYGGVPYMQATTGNAYRLLRFYNYENGVGTLNFVPIINTSRLNRERNGSYYFNAGSDIFGNSCASSTFWALSRVTNEIKGCWCATMVPATGNGFLPVGTYTYATGDNPGQILKKNTKATIFAAYEKLKPGDNLLSNGHAMMALSAPYTNSEGKRAVLVGEQIAIRTTTSGVGKEAATGDYGLYTQYDFNYRHQGKISEYTFETLSAKYIPIRVPEFEPTHAKYLAVEATQVTCSNSAANSGSATKISVSDFLNLSFSSNYVISDLTLKVTKNGKTETYFAMTGNPYKNDMSVHKKVKFNHTTNDSADYTAGKLDNIFAVLTYFNEAGDVIYVTQLSDLFAGASSITVDCQVSSGTVKTFNFTITG